MVQYNTITLIALRVQERRITNTMYYYLSFIHSPVRRKSTMLNMERMVGTITPKKVLSFLGEALGAGTSPMVSEPRPQKVELTGRPHTPCEMRGVCSDISMLSSEMFFVVHVNLLKGNVVRYSFFKFFHVLILIANVTFHTLLKAYLNA